MAKDRFTNNPYPDVQVTEVQRNQLIELVDGFVADHFQDYEEFAIADKSHIDKQRWKHVKSKENVHVYSERAKKKTVAASSSFESWNPADSSENTVPVKDLPVVLGAGTIAGELDDLMLGTVNPTQDIMRVSNSYVEDLDSAAILCPVVEPSEEEPFRSLVIKWMTIDLPLQATNLVKCRDFVYIEATGFVTFANGDRVGYFLLHSIEFPQTKPLPNVIRGNYSICGFFRQIDENVIEVFARGTIDPGGEIKRFLLIPSVAEALFTIAKCVHCGQMKKLSWMLLRQNSAAKRQSQMHNGKCVICMKKISRGAIGAVGRSTCKLCYGSVCYKCKVRKRISFIALDGQLIQRKISFCSKCLSKAQKADAKKVAIDQVASHETFKSYPPFSDSDSIEASGDEYRSDS